MKILVISGFLGAGKTTFIQELVRRTGRDFAIYENEYGEADIDARRLREDSDLRVWESVENCILSSVYGGHATRTNLVLNLVTPTEHSTWHILSYQYTELLACNLS